MNQQLKEHSQTGSCSASCNASVWQVRFRDDLGLCSSTYAMAAHYLVSALAGWRDRETYQTSNLLGTMDIARRCLSQEAGWAGSSCRQFESRWCNKIDSKKTSEMCLRTWNKAYEAPITHIKLLTDVMDSNKLAPLSREQSFKKR